MAETAYGEVVESLEALLKMHELMMAQIPHGKCFYSAETIAAMNTAPGRARAALEHFKEAEKFRPKHLGPL